MYKRFIALGVGQACGRRHHCIHHQSGRISTNRQDDGFRKVATQEFSDIYILDLGSDVRRNPKISGTTHNVFGIQTGVAVGFFVREKAKLGKCGIHYAKREDAELAVDKLSYLGKSDLDDIEFQDISPDKRNDWLNQGNPDFERLMPIGRGHVNRCVNEIRRRPSPVLIL